MVVGDHYWRRVVGRRSTATRLNVKKVRRASLVDCKAKSAGSESKSLFLHNPEMRCT
jgi:hypothetical protein